MLGIRCSWPKGILRVSVPIIGVILMLPNAMAQWTCSGGSCTTSGNVGIGTANPTAGFKIDVGGATRNTSALVVYDNGNIGGQNRIALGTAPKTVSPSGCQGCIYVYSGDTGSSQLQGGMELITDPTAANRRLAIGAVEQGTAFRNVTLAEGGGNVGIGTASPSAYFRLDTAGVIASEQGSNTWVTMGQDTDGAGYPLTYAGMWYDSASNALRLEALSGGIARRNIALNARGGNVGIGTTNPQHLLQVAGTVGAQEIIVSSTGADYVFDAGYRLRPLQDVATYIAANHHLPDVPSCAEMKEKGLSIGDMEAKLLAKIEELTLHMIEADRMSTRLLERVNQLENENREMRRQIWGRN